MQKIFLNDLTDVIWLFSTHLKNWKNGYEPSCQSFVLHGNEDCPQRIECFRRKEPSYKGKPFAIFVLNEELQYDKT